MADMIDLSAVQVFNSPDIHAWPATTTITKLSLQPTGVHVEFTKQDGPNRWPDFPFGDEGDHGSLQFTLWIVLNIFGQWCAAGCIEFWYGLYESGGPVEGYAKNWYYDPNRWPGMAGHQPAVGERVGFLITSGDARHGNDGVGLHERSNIVAIDFPAAAGAVFTFDAGSGAGTGDGGASGGGASGGSTGGGGNGAGGDGDAFLKLLGETFADMERIAKGIEAIAGWVESIDNRLQVLEEPGVRIRI